jgi:hypothetical protein
LYSYLIDSNGLHTKPVASHFAPIFVQPLAYSDNNYRFSPDASKFYGSSFFNNYTNAIRALDFDNSTGLFSSPQNLLYYGSGNGSDIGFVILSPDSKKLYFINNDNSNPLFQYNLIKSDSSSFVNSKALICTEISSFFPGADGKIYVSGQAPGTGGFVSEINRPDSSGIGCNYAIDNALSKEVLFNSFYTILTRQGFWPSFSIDTDAYNAFVLHFYYNDPRPRQKYKWNFGDAASGQLNHDTGAFVKHDFPFGTDTIRLVVTDQYGYDEVFKRAICINNPFVHPLHDTVICAGNSITLNSGNPTSTHLWSTGDTTQQVTLSSAGKYWVRFQFHNLTATDSFTIKYDRSYMVHRFLQRDTTICESTPLTINLDSIHGLLTWQDSIVSKTFTISQTGTYHASLQNACGTYNDSINVMAVPCNIFNINVFPNPFDIKVQVQVELSQSSNVQIMVYDAIGRPIVTLADIQQPTGPKTYVFDAEKYSLAPGVYFIKIVVGDKVYLRPVVRE